MLTCFESSNCVHCDGVLFSLSRITVVLYTLCSAVFHVHFMPTFSRLIEPLCDIASKYDHWFSSSWRFSLKVQCQGNMYGAP